MNAEEIFSRLVSHMIEGMMLHEQLANYFDFLALKGYRCCHDYHYLEETKAHRTIQKYYVEHFNRLLPESKLNITDIIPQSWLPHARHEVDGATKSDGVRNGLGRWREWEYETKRLYQDLYTALLSIGEVAASEVIKELVIDVDGELAEAEEMYLEASAVNFNLTVLIPEQEKMYKKYAKKQ